MNSPAVLPEGWWEGVPDVAHTMAEVRRALGMLDAKKKKRTATGYSFVLNGHNGRVTLDEGGSTWWLEVNGKAREHESLKAYRAELRALQSE
jgi:hypothetical protein